jgi:hypothetical protein
VSQNRAARISEKRGHLDLQLNLLSEQENTKMLRAATTSTGSSGEESPVSV